MAAYQEFHTYDNSSLANFKEWAMSINNAFATFGWVQHTDTGQVVWTATVFTLTQIAVSGSNAVYSYSGTTGATPRVGMSVTVTGFANGVNNVTATITAIGGGTFTVVKVSQVNETLAASATTTAIAAIPGSNTYVYEIWKPGDAGTTFYVKFEYGGGTTNPQARVLLSSTTNGAGTLTGFVLNASTPVAMGNSTSGGTATGECNYSGTSSRICIMMNRSQPSNINQAWFMGIERTLDNTGAEDNVGVTLLASSDNLGNPAGFQQSLIFGVGTGKSGGTGRPFSYVGVSYNITTWAINNYIPISPVFCHVPYANPMSIVAVCAYLDIGSGCIFDVTLFGNTITYMKGSSVQAFDRIGDNTGEKVLCMRYD